MEHEQLSPWLKVKKIGRYCRLYGPDRTFIKFMGHRHKLKHYEKLPASSRNLGPSQVVGIIGCGNFSFSNIAYFLTRKYGRVIGGCMDVDPHRAASLASYYAAPLYSTDAAEVIGHPNIRLLYIASNHASHAEYAIQALDQGKDVYVEKPHVVSRDQLSRLANKLDTSTGRIYLGFNRLHSHFTKLIRTHLEQQPGPALYNWFVIGHQLPPDHWYHRPHEGGRVLGNLCHWTDFLYSMVGPAGFPVRITPTPCPKDGQDLVVGYSFAEGSTGVISFSAKGYSFEGVRERLCAYKGNCQIVLDDFARLRVEVLDRKRVHRTCFRDHGHKQSFLAAFENSIHRQPYDRRDRLEYMANTAWLFLSSKEATDQGQPLVVASYRDTQSKQRAA